MECKFCKKQISNIGGLIQHEKKCEYLHLIKNEIIDLYVNKNYSFKDLKNKFKMQYSDFSYIIDDKVRSPSESRKVAQIKYPYKHTEQSKQKLREARLKFMKENPDKTAWRKSNLSYPEKLFLNKLIELGWETKYRVEREFSVFPYFIDFTFVNEMVAVEIDGSQHLLPERAESDKKKEELLISFGWHIIRVTENEIKTNLNEFMIKLEKILNNKEKVNKISFGVFKSKKERVKMAPGVFKSEKKKFIIKKRNVNGLTDLEIKSALNQRKVERPPLEQLLKEIELTNYCAVGRKYGVSDNAIRKWIKTYKKRNI